MRHLFFSTIQRTCKRRAQLPAPGTAQRGLFALSTSQAARAPHDRRYGPWYIWGQLVNWFKQTLLDPSSALSTDRRGTLALPDIESCYGNNMKQRYTAKVRACATS